MGGREPCRCSAAPPVHGHGGARSPRGEQAGLRGTYHTELGKTPGAAERLNGATPIGEPWACDATLYRSTQCADERVLLVGDAASFIEPLSAFRRA